MTVVYHYKESVNNRRHDVSISFLYLNPESKCSTSSGKNADDEQNDDRYTYYVITEIVACTRLQFIIYYHVQCAPWLK